MSKLVACSFVLIAGFLALVIGIVLIFHGNRLGFCLLLFGIIVIPVAYLKGKRIEKAINEHRL